MGKANPEKKGGKIFCYWTNRNQGAAPKGKIAQSHKKPEGVSHSHAQLLSLRRRRGHIKLGKNRARKLTENPTFQNQAGKTISFEDS